MSMRSLRDVSRPFEKAMSPISSLSLPEFMQSVSLAKPGLGSWIYSRLDRLSRSAWSGSYSNTGGADSAAVLRALSAAILRCTCSLDADTGEVSAATGLLTGSGFDLVPRPADLSFARGRVRAKVWTPPWPRPTGYRSCHRCPNENPGPLSYLLNKQSMH